MIMFAYFFRIFLLLLVANVSLIHSEWKLKYSLETLKNIEDIAMIKINEVVPSFHLPENYFLNRQFNLQISRKKLQSLSSKYGTFISIFDTKTKKLLGCMGSLYPVKINLLEEIEHWSLIAATQDPRFFKIKSKRTHKISIIISFILGLDKVGSFFNVNVIKDGLKATYKQNEALLLPGEAYTSRYAWKMLAHKLKVSVDQADAVEFYRLKAERFGSALLLFKQKPAVFKGYGG